MLSGVRALVCAHSTSASLAIPSESDVSGCMVFTKLVGLGSGPLLVV